MNLLISSDEQLRKFIPNCMSTVEGEPPLFSKMEPYLEAAQLELENIFLAGSALLHNLNTDSQAYFQCRRIVAYDAYRRALPALDLVLTPNGFATVGNQTLSPASRMRVDALSASLISERDEAIVQLIHALADMPSWRTSPSGTWFAGTLFPFPEVVRELGIDTDIFNKYLECRSKFIEAESILSENMFSRELMNALRSEVLENRLSPERKYLVENLRTFVLAKVRGTSISDDTMTPWINYVRLRPDAFPEWHDSSVADLFRPPVFRNSRDSAGYFF